MKDIPDFDVEFSQVIEYIFSSDLAQHAFQSPPFDNYSNILRETLVSIDRLADNCHMPEFTNHALPHICSVVKRASEWADNNGWIERISPQECGYLLIALVIHDIGMLSQDPTHLPDNEKLNSLKGLSDISTWVRKTHVIRLKKLYKELIEPLFNDNKDSLELIIQMASTHSIWPWDDQFEVSARLCVNTNTKKEHIMALCAVIAVTDLLDEDSNRCDTITLIKHRHGNVDNISHWIRHALTVNVSSIAKNEITIHFRKLHNLPNDFEIVYRALRNHYRLIKLYNSTLKSIKAEITIINFIPSDGITDYTDEVSDVLNIWQDNIELKYNLTRRILDTFMPEAKCICYNNETERHIKEIGLETISLPVSDMTETIEEQLVKEVNEENFFEILNYFKAKSELAYLDGNMGNVRFLCYLAMDMIEQSTKILDIEDVYWLASYMFVCFRKPMDFRQLKRIYTKYDGENCKITKNNPAYKYLINCLFDFYDLNHTDECIGTNIDKCMHINTEHITDDLPTALLIERISEILSFSVEDNDRSVKFLQYFIDICEQTHHTIYKMLAATHDRINLQGFVFSNNELPKLQSADDSMLFAHAWKSFFECEWDRLENYINMLIQKINPKSEYYISLIGLINMVNGYIKIQNHNEFTGTRLSDYQKYQKLESEKPLNIYPEELCDEIRNLIIKIRQKPNNSSSERIELMRYIMHIEIIAMKYWDLGLYLNAKEFMVELYVSLATYRNDKNQYAGLADYGKDCIITSIQAMDSSQISKDSKSDIIGIMEIHDSESFKEVYDYIFHKSKKVEWFDCTEWLECMGDNIPSDRIDDLLRWSYEFNEFAKKVRYRFNISKFNYLSSIINNFTLNNKQWDIIEFIVLDILVNPIFARSVDKLCYAILNKASIKRCKKYLQQMAANSCEPHNGGKTHEIIYNACINRQEIIEYGKNALFTIYSASKEPSILALYEYLSALYINKIRNINEEEILEKFKSDISLLTPHRNAYLHYGDMTFYYRNINWDLASDELINNIFEIFEAFIGKNSGIIYDAYFENILGIMKCIVINLSDRYKTRYITLIIQMIKDDYSVKSCWLSDFSDSPVSGIKIGSPIFDLKTYAYLYTIGEFCDVMTYEQLLFGIRWCIDIFAGCELIYYFSYIFSYCYLTKNGEIKQLAYAGLMMIRMAGNTRDNSMKLFSEALKGIAHILNRPISDTEKMIEYITKGSHKDFLEYILWCIRKMYKSFDYNIRLQCAHLLNILSNAGGYFADYDLKEIQQDLANDSRKSIRDEAKGGRS